MKFLTIAALTAPVFFANVTFSAAADIVIPQDITYTSEDNGITITGGVGVLAIESREYVFRGSGSNDLLSLLIWQSTAPLLTTSLEVELPNSWSINASANVAMTGDSYMEDYDWIVAGLPGSPDMTNWSHRSRHPDTDLDWYFNGSLLATYTFDNEEGPDFNVHGGVEYTDVQWSAYGGDYVYSSGPGFRDLVGEFPEGERGITYRQQFPALVTGANVIFSSGDWTFDLGAKGGLTFGSKATDDHWMRDLRFTEDVYVAPVLGASASAEYAVNDKLNLFVSGQVDRIFLGRSNTELSDIPTGDTIGQVNDASGADLFSGALKVGFKGSF